MWSIILFKGLKDLMLCSQISGLKIAVKTIHGNAVILLLTNVLCWPIQFAFISQYLPVFLTSPEIGLSKEQFGFLCSITSCTVMVGGFLSGMFAARFNPKIVNACGDLLSFAVSALLWCMATSHRPVVLVVAAIFSGAWGWHNTSFHLLFTYRQNKETLPSLYLFFSIAMMGMGLLTPLAGLLLRHFDLITLMRTMLLVNACLVAGGVVIRLLFVKRYQPDRIREHTKPLQFMRTFRILAAGPLALRTLFVLVFINGICNTARVNYGNIYYIETLGISKSAISILPAISSVVLIAVTLLAISHFKASAATQLIRTAYILLLTADILISVAPRSTLGLLVVSVIILALGGFILQAFTNATVMNLSKKEHWPYLIGLNVPIFALSGFVAAPIMGKLYEIWPRAPFIASASFSLLCLVIAFRMDFRPIHEPVSLPVNPVVPVGKTVLNVQWQSHG